MANEKTCAKIKFITELEAKDFADSLKHTIANELEAYYCGACAGWHIRLPKPNLNSLQNVRIS
jgi:hypothetical protein